MPLDDQSKQVLAGLIDELRSAIPKTFDSLIDEFPDLCGFAIGTTVYIEFVTPIYQTSNELPDGEQSCWERFSPPEWAVMNDRNRNDSFGDAVASARSALEEHCSSVDGDTSYEIRMAYLDALLSLFVELESGKKFGAKTDKRFLAIWIPDNSDWLIKSSEKLNTKATHKRLLEHVG